jgi:hypothetical protein
VCISLADALVAIAVTQVGTWAILWIAQVLDRRDRG